MKIVRDIGSSRIDTFIITKFTDTDLRIYPNSYPYKSDLW